MYDVIFCCAEFIFLSPHNEPSNSFINPSKYGKLIFLN